MCSNKNQEHCTFISRSLVSPSEAVLQLQLPVNPVAAGFGVRIKLSRCQRQ